MHHSLFISLLYLNFIFFSLQNFFFFKNLILIFSLFTTFHLTETIHKSRRTTTTSKSKPTNHTLKYTNLDADYTSSATSHCHTWYVQQLSNPIKHISSHNQTIHSHKFFTKSNPQPNKPWQPHGRWASPEPPQVVAHSQQPPKASINCHQNPNPSYTQPI